MTQAVHQWHRNVRVALMLATLTTTIAWPAGTERALAFQSGPGGGSGGGGSGGHSGSGSGSGSGSTSGSSGSGSHDSGSWTSDSGSSGSGSGSSGSGSGWSGSGSGSWGSGSSGGYSGSGDTLSEFETSKSGSGSDYSNSGSGSWDRESDPSGDRSGSSNSGSGRSDAGHGSSWAERNASSMGSLDYWHQLAAREAPEFDAGGFPVRRGEIVATDLTPEQIRAVEEKGLKVVERVRLAGLNMTVFRLRLPKGMTAADAKSALNGSQAEGSFELDHFFGMTSGTMDSTKGAALIEMRRPGKERLWVGMIDTAVWTNATLRGLRVDARDFVKGAKDPPFAHGTAVASILARQGAVRITAANIFSADRRPYSSAEAVAKAVNWMVERKVPVINISIAGPRNALVDKAIAAAIARGHVVVAAAGNEGPAAPPAYPAASPGALAVTAVDRNGRVYPSANRGPHIEIAAVGVGIAAEAPDGSLKPHSGTSFAAPFVSAALARCLRAPDPKRSLECVRGMESRARDLGPPGRDPIYGHGLLVP
jgi:Subtilase family